MFHVAIVRIPKSPAYTNHHYHRHSHFAIRRAWDGFSSVGYLWKSAAVCPVPGWKIRTPCCPRCRAPLFIDSCKTDTLSSRPDRDSAGCGSFQMLTLCDSVCPVQWVLVSVILVSRLFTCDLWPALIYAARHFPTNPLTQERTVLWFIQC